MSPNLNIIKEDIDKHFKKGYELIHKDKEKAIEKFEKSLKKHPKHFSTYNNLLFLYMTTNKNEELIKTIDRGLEFFPENPILLYFKGYVLKKAKKYNLAVKYFKDSLNFDPENTETLVIAGNCLMGLNEYEGSIDFYNRALEIDPINDLAYLNKINLLKKLKRTEELEETINFASKNYFNQAIEDQKNNKIISACVNFAKVLRYDETHDRARENLELSFDDLEKNIVSVSDSTFEIFKPPDWNKKGLLFFKSKIGEDALFQMMIQKFMGYLDEFGIPYLWIRILTYKNQSLWTIEFISDVLESFIKKFPEPYLKLEENLELKVYKPILSEESLDYYGIKQVRISIWDDNSIEFYILGGISMTIEQLNKKAFILLESLDLNLNQVKMFVSNNQLIAAVEILPNSFKDFQDKTKLKFIELVKKK
ncbi:MAG: hypothetical protein EU549_02090 [Promethearchaeota archaeon]|nr:MAG: hypothetical protein EU549_02090 [Candidatus Lokiarchaeota archaeon]